MSTYMGQPAWIPPDIDKDQPSVARIYDYHLGGGHNFPVDRALAQEAVAAYPDLPLVQRANRAFLRRAVSFLVAEGIDQFLDLGSGIPTVGNVHEIAQAANPACRIVYVDREHVAVAHSRAILADNPQAAAVLADIRDPDAVLSAIAADQKASGLLDYSRPLGLLMVAVLHFVADDEQPAELVRHYLRGAADGSHLAISHATLQKRAEAEQQAAIDEYVRRRIGFYARDQATIAAMFTGLELVEPGVVYTTAWRPEPGNDAPEFGGDHERSAMYAGIARLHR